MRKRIKSLLQSTLEVEDVILETPKNKDFGHFATPVAFQLAKVLKKAPVQIAAHLVPQLEKLEIFSKVENINGYINLTLSSHFLDAEANTFLNKPLKFTPKDHPQKNSGILLEYVSANPTGPLHIGHARGAVFGDTLMRLGRYLGHDITTEYYINDAGSQIQTLGLSILLAGREHLLNQTVEYPEQYYRGEYIIDIAKSAMDRFGPEIFASDANINQLSDFGKDLMLEEIKDNLKNIGITFDSFISEKALYNQWDKTLNALKDKNAIYEKDEKIWLKSQDLGDEKDRVIIRENGEPTYLAGDIIYHYQKFERNFKHYINIWGADHHGYIQRIKASIEHLGYDSSHLEIILAQMVSLLKNGEPYKMSKRAGNFILLRDVVEDIGADALRFIFLSRRLDSMLEFDTSDLEKQDSSNPIFYINYANARIHTLLSKSTQTSNSSLEGLDPALNKEALDLLFLAMQLDHIIESAFNERALQKLCDYLKDLSAGFHKFYNAHKILDTPNEAMLLKIMKVVSHSITLGLSLLGIDAKTKM